MTTATSSNHTSTHKNEMHIDISRSRHPKGLILLIDDDKDEHEFFIHTLSELEVKNEVKYFGNGQEALDFIRKTKEDIFLIFCDINMPKMDGMELKRRIEGDVDLKTRSVPFIYHSNSTSPAEIRTAFTLNIQGFIKKGDNKQTANMLKAIFYFWSNCIHPKDVA
jgi:CheY-like chemotaxis protein